MWIWHVSSGGSQTRLPHSRPTTPMMGGRSFAALTFCIVAFSANAVPGLADNCTKQIGVEYPDAGEEKIFAMIVGGNAAKLKAQLPRSVVRGAHSKTNACAKATWMVDADVPAELQHGVFKKGSRYEAWVRFSNGAGNGMAAIQSDGKPAKEPYDDRDVDVRGLAIKLMNVDGEKNMQEQENTTQDFIFISSLGKNAFFAGRASDYLPQTIPGGTKPATGFDKTILGDLLGQYKKANPLNVCQVFAIMQLGRLHAAGGVWMAAGHIRVSSELRARARGRLRACWHQVLARAVRHSQAHRVLQQDRRAFCREPQLHA